MSLSFKPFSDFLLVIGIKGGGKSVFTRWVAKGLNRFLMLDPTWQNGHLGYVVHNPKYLQAAFHKFSKVVYQPIHTSDAYIVPFFEVAMCFCNYTLIIDEVEEHLGSKHVVCDEAKTVCVRGRNQGIGIVCNTRRPHDINKCVRSQADHVVTFQMEDDDDLEYMRRWIGKEKHQIKELRQYYSFYYNRYNHQVIELSPCPET